MGDQGDGWHSERSRHLLVGKGDDLGGVMLSLKHL